MVSEQLVMTKLNNCSLVVMSVLTMEFRGFVGTKLSPFINIMEAIEKE